jgi:hypothetical protein
MPLVFFFHQQNTYYCELKNAKRWGPVRGRTTAATAGDDDDCCCELVSQPKFAALATA